MSCRCHVLHALQLETRKMMNTRSVTDNLSLYLVFIPQYLVLYDCITNEHHCFQYRRHNSDINGMVFHITDNCFFNSLLWLTTKYISKLRTIDPLFGESTSNQWFPFKKDQLCGRHFHDMTFVILLRCQHYRYWHCPEYVFILGLLFQYMCLMYFCKQISATPCPGD